MLKQFNSNARKLNRNIPKINPNNLVSSDLTGSLENIQIPSENTFNSNVRSNPTPTKLINNKGKIKDFHTEILQFGARYIERTIDTFDSVENTLTLYNTALDYGTEGATPDNFEVIVNGLHLPGIFTINQIGNNVVIKLLEDFIDYEIMSTTNIYVIGKLVDIVLDTEDYFDLRTENDENIII